jgi:hypothetical protein
MPLLFNFTHSKILVGRGVGPSREGADQFWMYSVEGTSEELKNYFELFLENPTLSICETLGIKISDAKKERLFEPDYPVNLIFQYGYQDKKITKGNIGKPETKKIEKYVFKGEYGTNVVTVFCPPYKKAPGKSELDTFIKESVLKVDITFIEPLGTAYTHFDINTVKTGDDNKDILICKNLARIIQEPALVPALLTHAVQNAKMYLDKDKKPLLGIYVIKESDSKPDSEACRTRKIKFFIPDQPLGKISSYKFLYTAPPHSRAVTLYRPSNSRSKKLPQCVAQENALLDPCLKSAAGYVVGVNNSSGFENPSPNTAISSSTGQTYVAVGIDSSHLSGWQIVSPTTSGD